MLSRRIRQRRDEAIVTPARPPVELVGRSISNRAVARVLGQFGGDGTARAAKARSGLGHVAATLPEADGTIRVFDNPASHRAAASLGAHAYSWAGDVFLGGGLGRPGHPSRAEALRHERVHALQARLPGPRASAPALEREAHRMASSSPRQAADPDAVLGLWWVIPIGVGLYTLLRPKPANAPAPGEKTVETVSELQIVGEALATFAVPGAVTKGLLLGGYGVVSAFAVGGAASSVSYRGVQDVGEGEFSGVEAYVVDAATGAVIGAVIGGTVHVFKVAAPVSGRNPSLVHLTDVAGETGITSSGVLKGSQGIYAVPSSAANEGAATRVFRTLLPPSRTARAVGVPAGGSGAFTQPLPLGPVSAYQRAVGVHRAPAGAIDIATGAFTPSTRTLANVTGQFWPYGVDALLWATATAVSPAAEGAYDRGHYAPLHDMVGDSSPLAGSQRSDGPFIFLQEDAVTDITLADSVELAHWAPTDQGAEAAQDELVCLPEEQPRPAVIFVAPLDPAALEGLGSVSLGPLKVAPTAR